MLILKTFLTRRNSDDDTVDFPRKEEQWLYGTFSKRRNRLKIYDLFRKEEQVEDVEFLQKGGTSRRYGLSLERNNRSKT